MQTKRKLLVEISDLWYYVQTRMPSYQISNLSQGGRLKGNVINEMVIEYLCQSKATLVATFGDGAWRPQPLSFL